MWYFLLEVKTNVEKLLSGMKQFQPVSKDVPNEVLHRMLRLFLPLHDRLKCSCIFLLQLYGEEISL
jgi:hypothetical protein